MRKNTNNSVKHNGWHPTSLRINKLIMLEVSDEYEEFRQSPIMCLSKVRSYPCIAQTPLELKTQKLTKKNADYSSIGHMNQSELLVYY